MYDIIFVSPKNNQSQYKTLCTKYPTAKFATSFEQAQRKALSDMFYVVWDDVDVQDNFTFDYEVAEWDKKYVHTFLNDTYFDGICLVPRDIHISTKEIKHRFFVNKKEVDIVASMPTRYDVFYIDSYEDYENALENSSTEMFWAVSRNLKYSQSYINNFYFSHHNSYDRKENHAFVHEVDGRKLYNGVFLCSQNKPLNKKQIDYRFLVNAKQWDDVVSEPRQYEICVVNTYEDYLAYLETVETELFWMIPPHVLLRDDFEFDLYFSHDNEFDRKINHVFKNGEYYDGIVLCSKHAPISKREFKYKFITNKKEHNIVASEQTEYDKIVVNSYEEFCELKTKVSTDFFYVIPNDVEVDWDFKYHIPYYEKNNVHLFKNNEYYDGIFLIHKENEISQREFDYRFFRNKKEVDIVVSTVKSYDKIYVDDYDDFILQMTTTNSNFVWVIPNDVDVDWDFKYHIPYYERDNVHVFKNGKYHDGVFLIHNNKPLAQREFDYKFFVNKKEIDITVSTPAPYDVAFISYKEPNADKHFQKLQDKIRQEDPRISLRWVRDVKGIHQAHKKAAELSSTRMFFVVDGDADMCDDFKFDYQVPAWDETTVHVWRSINPVNGLQYGNGGVKLLPKLLTENVDVNTTDMTTSISDRFKVVDQISNYTAFNTDAYNTWKSAFRECTKLASKSITGQIDDETEDRLQAWLHPIPDASFREEAKRGAEQGTVFGKENKNKPEVLALINDFDWLEEQFQNSYD